MSLGFFGFLSFGVPLLFGFVMGDLLFNTWEIGLSFVWLAVGALLIDVFEYSIELFGSQFQSRLVHQADREKFERMKTRFLTSRRYLVFSGVFYVVFFLLMRDILAEHTIATVILVEILLIPAALMWGIIFHLALSMYGFVRDACGLDVKVNVFDPDGFGGFSTIGNLSTRVTALVASGSIYIPFAINRIRSVQSPNVTLISILGIAGMITGIVVTFTATILPVHHLARDAKRRMLATLGDDLATRLDDFGKDVSAKSSRDLTLLLTLESYRELKSMRVWPFDPQTVLNLAGLIFIPIALFVLGFLLETRL